MKHEHMWGSAPRELTLSSNEVHIWRASLDLPSQVEDFAATLSRDEISRADRFHFPQHRDRFIVGRGILRNILGRYLCIAPKSIEFSYQSRGKPILADSCGGDRLYFNLSHSQDLALYAVSSNLLIGIDLEYIRTMPDVMSLAERFFLPSEYEVLRSLESKQAQTTFFRYWTCKEAYLKATGDGLVQLSSCEVALLPDKPAALKTAPEWSLLELNPGDNYVAAVAYAASECQVKYWEY